MGLNLGDDSLEPKNINAEVLMAKTSNGTVKRLNECDQCDYSSFRTGHFNVHMKIHNGEKPNKCNQCNYASSDPSALKRHLKIHSGEKSHKCNQCDYASSYASDLRRHLKRHNALHCNGEK